MALSREQSVFTYRSTNGGKVYSFDIVLDSLGNKNLRNICAPNGLITNSLTSVPQVVIDDINRALEIVSVQSSEVVVISGTETFSSDTEVSVSIPDGTLNTANYRVVYTTTDGSVFKTEAKTTSSFTIVSSSEYTGDVDWAVFVSPAPSVSFSGSASFALADASVKTITFPSALATSSYRVILTPDGFYPVGVTSKSKTGFTLALGIGLTGSETAVVGYDVVV